eukprot:2594626-Rhodomonas_salina.1
MPTPVCHAHTCERKLSAGDSAFVCVWDGMIVGGEPADACQDTPHLSYAHRRRSRSHASCGSARGQKRLRGCERRPQFEMGVGVFLSVVSQCEIGWGAGREG